MLSRKSRIILAILAASIMLLDNITTWLVISSGGGEKNPIVAFFLQDSFSYILFTYIKVFVAGVLTYYYVRTKKDAIFWGLVMMIFVRAIYINIMNYFHLTSESMELGNEN